MSRDFGVTDGHPLYSLHRYRSDVRHMVIFDDLVEKEHHRRVAPDKKTLKKSVKSMFFMVQTRCEVETIKY
ncbi:MAG: hypothetical protein HPZ81_06235 [Oscillospiraceae bacterium]|nr:hypothetical protein [Oscillospiraceae bacterium]